MIMLLVGSDTAGGESATALSTAGMRQNCKCAEVLLGPKNPDSRKIVKILVWTKLLFEKMVIWVMGEWMRLRGTNS